MAIIPRKTLNELARLFPLHDVSDIYKALGLLDRSYTILKTNFDALLASNKNIEAKINAYRALEPEVIVNDVEIRKRVESAAADILIANFEYAVKSNPEFWEPGYVSIFLNALNEKTKPLVNKLVLKNPIKSSDIANLRIQVKFNMAGVFGSADDYGNIVKTVRKELGYGDKAKGIRASWYWYRLFRANRQVAVAHSKKSNRAKNLALSKLSDRTKNLSELYRKIIVARGTKERQRKKASFWYILNYGNIGIKLSSDKGGVGKPAYGPTFFVQASERATEQWIKANLYNIIRDVTEGKAGFRTAYKDVKEEGTGGLMGEYREGLAELKQLDIRLKELKVLIDKLEPLITTATPKEPGKTLVGMSILVGNMITNTSNISNIDIKNVSKFKTNTKRAYDRLLRRIQMYSQQIALGEIKPEQRLYLGTIEGKEYRKRMKLFLANLESVKLDYEKSLKSAKEIEALRSELNKTILELKGLY